jgi:hypothetical protein
MSEDPQQVYESTREALTGSKAGGGLVLGASNAIEQGFRRENYLAYHSAWKEFGKY